MLFNGVTLSIMSKVLSILFLMLPIYYSYLFEIYQSSLLLMHFIEIQDLSVTRILHKQDCILFLNFFLKLNRQNDVSYKYQWHYCSVRPFWNVLSFTYHLINKDQKITALLLTSFQSLMLQALDWYICLGFFIKSKKVTFTKNIYSFQLYK